MVSVLSPIIEKLRLDLQSGNQVALVKEFWAHIEKKGSPLTELYAEDEDRVLVTFVWRGDSEGQEVVIYGEFPGFDMVNNRLEQLEGTNIYYKTFAAPTSIWSLYIFRLPGEPGTDSPQYVVDPFNPVTYSSPLDDDGRCPLLAPVESVLVLPGVVGEPWQPLTSITDSGVVHNHLFASTTLGNERRVWEIGRAHV